RAWSVLAIPKAFAGRELFSAAFIHPIFPPNERSFRRNAETSTPEAGAPRNVRAHARFSYGVVAGAGAGELKLNCTGGGFSAPGCAAKNGFGGKPSMPAIKFVGKLRTATLYSCTVLLKLPRSTEIRFSVPSNCACRLRKFWFAFNSGYRSETRSNRDSAALNCPCAA